MTDAKKVQVAAFQDITGELWRAYRFPDGHWVRIEAPVKLRILDNGEHQLVSEDGQAHVVPYGWTHLRMQPKPGVNLFGAT